MATGRLGRGNFMKSHRKTVLAILVFLSLGSLLVHAAWTSPSFEHIDYAAVAKGGDFASQAGDTNLAVIDESACGIAQSTNFQSYAGFIYVLPYEGVRIVSQPSPPVVGPGGSSSFQWVCDWTGSYSLLLGAMTLESGSCTAGVPVTSTVYESDLWDDGINTLTVSVSAAPNFGSVNVTVEDDQSGPAFNPLELTQVTGAVDDSSITQITVRIVGQPDQNVPVSGGNFSFTCPAGTTEVVIIAGEFSRRITAVP
jgi:hypothetical protein